jgi:hypothetical protein
MQMCILLFYTKDIKCMEPFYHTSSNTIITQKPLAGQRPFEMAQKDGSPKMPDLDCVVDATTPSILLKPLLHHPDYMRYHIL